MTSTETATAEMDEESPDLDGFVRSKTFSRVTGTELWKATRAGDPAAGLVFKVRAVMTVILLAANITTLAVVLTYNSDRGTPASTSASIVSSIVSSAPFSSFNVAQYNGGRRNTLKTTVESAYGTALGIFDVTTQKYLTGSSLTSLATAGVGNTVVTFTAIVPTAIQDRVQTAQSAITTQSLQATIQAQILASGVNIAAPTVAGIGPAPTPTTAYPQITTLDVGAYVGRWTEVYGNAGFLSRFGDNKCITADYSLVPGRTDAISLVNTNQATATGANSHTNGFATQSPDAGAPGSFVVVQGNPGVIDRGQQGRPAPTEPAAYTTANYVIMALGPVVNGFYDYALITNGPGQTFLSVLARDPSVFKAKYEASVLASLRSWGFTTSGNSPVAINQTGCRYAVLYPKVPALNASLYLGRWYSAYGNAGFLDRFGNNKCNTADYSAVTNRTDAIALVNTEVPKAGGASESTNGFATQSPDITLPGDFYVVQGFVNSSTLPPPTVPAVYNQTKANYIIMALGPQTAGTNLYEYALITSPGETFLSVIVRNLSVFKAKYEASVLLNLKNWGFTTTTNSPVAIDQTGCTY